MPLDGEISWETKKKTKENFKRPCRMWSGARKSRCYQNTIYNFGHLIASTAYS